MTVWELDTSCGCRENPGVIDTGNGALRYVEVSAQHPGVRRITVRTYCGRTYDNRCYYQTGDGSRHNTLRQASAVAHSAED